MEKFINSYTGGMNKDSSPNRYSNQQYLDAQNIRVITSGDELTSGAVTNIKGNSIALTLPDNASILGSVALRDYLIIFAKGDGDDYIFRVPKTSISTAQNFTLTPNYYFSTGASTTLDNVVYKGTLGFDLNYPIHAVSNYETTSIQKVYWVDGLNTLRHINIVYNVDTNDLENLAPDLFEISPKHTYGTIGLTLGAGGNLHAGKIQYAYQLYTINGSETMYSPSSRLINIAQYSEKQSIDRQAGGSSAETIVNKSVEVVITLESDYTNFNRIRLVALEYEDYNLLPQVRLVSERGVTTQTVTIIDYGSSIGDLALEQFQFIQHEITPKTIESKKNHLFAGNIQEEIFDIDELWQGIKGSTSTFVDPRSYRAKELQSGEPYSGSAYYSPPAEGIHQSTFSIDKTTGAWTIVITNVDETATPHGADWDNWTGVFKGGGLGDYLTIKVEYTYTGGEPSGTWYDTIDLDLSSIANPAGWTFNAASNYFTLAGTGFGTNTPEATWQAGTGGILPLTYVSVALDDDFYAGYDYSGTTSSSEHEVTINKGAPLNSSEQTLNFTGAVATRYGVSIDDDVLNTFNNISNDITGDLDADSHAFKFKPNSTPGSGVLGGEGKFLNFSFITEIITAFSATITGIKYTSAYMGYADPDNAMNFTSYQRDEVYRFGVVFYDLDGRRSPIKWIADIRMPDISEEALTVNATNTIKSLGVAFEINWTNFDTLYTEGAVHLIDQISGVQIVRVPRTDKDKSIKAQGILSPIALMGGTNYDSSLVVSTADEYNTGNTGTAYTSVQNDSRTMLKTTFDFLSPQATYNQDITTGANDFIEVIAGANMTTTLNNVAATLKSVVQCTNNVIYSANDFSTTNRGAIREDVTYAGIHPPQERNPASIVVSPGDLYEPRIINDTSNNGGYRGTALLVSIENAFDPGDIIHNPNERIFANYRTYLEYSHYGGATYYDRPFNSYIELGDFSVSPPSSGLTTDTLDIYEGDVFVTPYNHMHSMVDVVHESVGMQNLVGFIVESPINIAMQTTPLLKYFDDLTTFSNLTDLENTGYAVLEFLSTGILHYPEYYPTELGNLYTYNSAYSAEKKDRTHTLKPFDFQGTNVWDYRVYVSGKKFPAEYSDSWLNFDYNNYLDVDADKDAITRLINHKDKLFFFQPKGVGIVSVAERELIQTTNTAQLVLGTGGILERYDYLDTKTGTEWHDAIIDTGGYLMYYDNILKQIRSVTGATEPTSEIKGLKSYYDNVTIGDLITAYDFENREVLFSPTGDAIGEPTNVFSGFLNVFTGFYTLSNDTLPVQRYIALDELLLSSADLNEIYLHNVGAYGQFYDSASVDVSSIELIINPLQQQPITLHGLTWLSSIFSAVDIVGETLDWLQITNSYQDTGALNLTSAADVTKRRLRSWRVGLLRDSSDDGRLRDSYMKTKFSYDNDDGYRMTLHDIISDYLPTKVR